MWADYFMDYVLSKNNKIRYWALPDSAFYVDYKSLRNHQYDYKNQMQALQATINDPNATFPQAACAQNYGNMSYMCFLTEYMFQFIRAPLFIIQSGYDAFQIPNILQSKCTKMSNCTAD